jgi:NhaA family Na+:H+ antiporter
MTAQRKKRQAGITETFKDFFHSSTSGGIVLLICTAVALLWANSPWSESYFTLWEEHFSIGIGSAVLSKTLLHWINDGLMVIFFFFVGLEIKREILVGELSSLKKAMLPILAAVGGMIGPALIYLFFNPAGSDTAHGWGIPMATDIAFALGILALLGDKVPPGLKIFLAALAIADDMGAVLVIALFYTSELSLTMLAAGGVFILLLIAANRFNVRSSAIYTILGIGLWFCFLKSGIHATIAGVLLAMTIPVSRKIDKEQFIDESTSALRDLKNNTDRKSANELIHKVAALSEEVQSPLHRFEHALHPFVSFLIMPVFAIANAGVKIEGSVTDALLSPVGLGVALGLMAGKQIGIFSFVWIAVKAKVAALPENVSWGMIYGTTWLCAIGFTMALFIASLAFTTEEPLIISKIAILFASSISAVIGLFILSRIRYQDR